MQNFSYISREKNAATREREKKKREGSYKRSPGHGFEAIPRTALLTFVRRHFYSDPRARVISRSMGAKFRCVYIRERGEKAKEGQEEEGR